MRVQIWTDSGLNFEQSFSDETQARKAAELAAALFCTTEDSEWEWDKEDPKTLRLVPSGADCDTVLVLVD